MEDVNEHNKANEQKWDIWARDGILDNGLRSFYFRYCQKSVISIANLQRNANFLDLGCGIGWAVCYAANLLKEQGNFVGIDISEGMIAKAKESALSFKNVSFYKASSEELPLESNFFDSIICTNSFHHYLNPIKVLTEVKRILKPKGRIYILDATADNFLVKWLDGRERKKDKTHRGFYSTVEYKNMSSQSGLKYIQWKPIMLLLKVQIAEK